MLFIAEAVSKVSIYPNPNQGTFYINTGVTQTLPARILNDKGAEVWCGELAPQSNSIVLNLPTGMYFLHTQQAGVIRINKIMVVR